MGRARRGQHITEGFAFLGAGRGRRTPQEDLFSAQGDVEYQRLHAALSKADTASVLQALAGHAHSIDSPPYMRRSS
jgi:hypothetical protein